MHTGFKFGGYLLFLVIANRNGEKDGKSGHDPDGNAHFGDVTLDIPHAEGQVLLELDVSDKDLGIAPGLGLMIAMFPHHARKLAGLLYKEADAAEGIANLQS